jgi:thiol-disulfide isomerase/thioredoxin
MSKLAMAAAVLACGGALSSCRRGAKPEQGTAVPAVVDTQWTSSAAKRAERLMEAALKKDPKRGGMKYALPQLRVYDAKGQLVYSLDPTRGWSPERIGGEIDRAIASEHPISGPSLNETLGDLQTTDGRAAANVVAARGTPLVFDYWASWCVPCKILEKALVQWQRQKPAGSLQIVKAETDLMKLQRERGEKVFMLKKGPDGKLHKVEMK